ncbi:sialic acid-binding Ig-like lectin 15 [Rhinoraja longicauda]
MKGTPLEESVVFNHNRSYPISGHGTNIVNRGGRYELVGKLDKGDASIRVRGLVLNDTNDYFCHVWTTWNSPRKELIWVTQDETRLQVLDGKKKTSLVIGKRSDSATLPCSFSPSIRNPSPITIRWMKGSPREESTVFNHSVNPPYNVTIKGGGRYELVGKLDQGDASIRVKELRLNDSSDYFCHVWVRNFTQETVTQDETKLEVVVPATILELFVGSGNGTGEHTLVCRAEGKPPANITWIGPGNSTLPVNSGEMRVTHDPEKLLTVGELLHPRMPGKYTCVAVNEHQRDMREIHLFEHGLRALAIRAAIYAVYFLMIGFTFCWLKRGERHHLSSNAGVNRSDAAPPSGSVRFR